MHDLTAPAHLPELRVGNAQVAKPVGDPFDPFDRALRTVRLRWRAPLRARRPVEHLEAAVERLLRHFELGIGREERREHLVLPHGVARRDAFNVAGPAADGGDDRIRPVLVRDDASGRPQQPGAGQAPDDAEPNPDRLLLLGTHLHRALRQRVRRGVAAGCAALVRRLEVHAADRAGARMVAVMFGVHRTAVDGCGTFARVRRGVAAGWAVLVMRFD